MAIALPRPGKSSERFGDETVGKTDGIETPRLTDPESIQLHGARDFDCLEFKVNVGAATAGTMNVSAIPHATDVSNNLEKQLVRLLLASKTNLLLWTSRRARS
jgi:hypothetical protein